MGFDFDEDGLAGEDRGCKHFDTCPAANDRINKLKTMKSNFPDSDIYGPYVRACVNGGYCGLRELNKQREID